MESSSTHYKVDHLISIVLFTCFIYLCLRSIDLFNTLMMINSDLTYELEEQVDFMSNRHVDMRVFKLFTLYISACVFLSD